jgi:hypothetical protein
MVSGNCTETSGPAIETYKTRFLVLEAVSSVPNVYRRIGLLEVVRKDWMKNSGITIDSHGKAVYSEDGSSSEITLV